MTTEERLKIIREVSEEIIGYEELKEKIEKKDKLIAYDGFEPSGRIHIAQGAVRALNIQKLLKAGIHFKMLIADWHAYANNKMGGDLEKIHKVGEYFIEVWKATGLNTDDVEFVWASDLVKDPQYWATVLKISKEATLKRVIRCSEIMGRKESDSLSASQIIYPVMQATDIFFLNADIAQLGMDQRKVNMLARQIAPQVGFEKPIAIHHHMLISLQPPVQNAEGLDKLAQTIELKMSKSKPDSAIFMTDTPEEVHAKIKKAYCPPGTAENNPILEYFKYIVFPRHSIVEILREERFGGNIAFETYEDLEKAYIQNEVYSLDLKENLARYIDEILEPVRIYFSENDYARKLKEEIESYQVTR